jgi:nicotinamide-nucleotide amidase
MEAEIITVGTELITGKTVDTHSSYISKRCYQLGISVHRHSSVGDERTEMYRLFQEAGERSDCIFICGGMGPTADDISKEVLADCLGLPLQQDEALLQALKQHFSSRGIRMTENNERQTYVFPTGEQFPNHYGTAPGLAVSQGRATYILLPGPPRELVPMFTKYVMPYLQKRFASEKVFVTEDLTFFGLGESLLETRIRPFIEETSNPSIATYLADTEVIVRLTTHAPNQSQAAEMLKRTKEKILSTIGEYCFSQKDERLEETVIHALQQQQATVAVAESCTGGRLAHLLTTVPGSSHVFMGGAVLYTRQAKEQFLQLTSDEFPASGAVSYETAKRLAEQAKTRFGVDFALSVTGVAGPTQQEGKSVGLVYIGLAAEDRPAQVYQLNLAGSRQRIQTLAAKHALFILLQRMKER